MTRFTTDADAVPVPPSLLVDWRKPARFGYVMVFLFFGVCGTWAFYAPLDSAVLGQGVVAVESNRKTVQHLEGGIIAEILVRDGQHVEAGDLLFRLDDKASRAQQELLRNQLTAALIREARLVAERDEVDHIAFPPLVPGVSDHPTVRRAMEDEMSAFRQRRALLHAQIDAQRNRIVSVRREIQGLMEEEKSALAQIDQINRELPGMRSLLQRGLVALPRVTLLERERVRLQGIAARTQTDQSKAEQSIIEGEIQELQLRAQFQQTVAADLVEIRKAINDSRERLAVAEDVARRTEIRAPQAGVVQGRRVSTIGAVVRAGDTLVEIAPTDEQLVIQARVNPRDINVVRRQMGAEVRFPGIRYTETPLMLGSVLSLSNDRLTDPNGQNAYFAVEIKVDPATVPPHIRERIKPGMDAEILVATGERSALRYLIEPLEERLRSSLRER